MRKFLMLLMLSMAPLVIWGRNFRIWDISDGLSNNSVKVIAQDSLGLIWFGTFDGLCRFNGRSFDVFRHNPSDSNSIIGNHINSICADSTGLWIGTRDGLCYFSIKDNLFYRCNQILPNTPKSIINAGVQNILSVNGEIYVHLIYGQILRRESGLNFKLCTFSPDYKWNAICKYKDNLLVGYADNICVIDPQQNKIISNYNGKEVSGAREFMYYSSTKDLLYVGHGIGYPSQVFKINENKSITVVKNNSTANLKAVIDYNGDVVLATDGNGLYRHTKSNPNTCIPMGGNMPSDAVYSLFVDAENNLWIGTYRGGVAMYSPQYEWFKTLNVENGVLSHNTVTAIVQHNDKLYVGLDGGGLNIHELNVGRSKALTTRNSELSGNNILSMSCDEQHLWMGVYGKGLCSFSFSAENFETYPLESSNANKIWQIKDDNRGNIWVAGENLYIFNKQSRSYTKPINISTGVYQSVSGIVFDKDVAWISLTSGYIHKIDKASFTIIETIDIKQIANTGMICPIRYIFADSKHQLWLYIEHAGLFCYNYQTKNIKKYSNEHGLTDRNVVSILEHNNGMLWMSTYNGLFRFNPQTEKFTRWGVDNKAIPYQYNFNACYRSPQTMYFGGTSGLVYFNPDNIQYTPKYKPAYFTNVEVLDGTTKTLGLENHNSQSIELSYLQNFFTIKFAVAEFVNPNNMYFSCYMENYDKGWRTLTNINQVSYTNVQPGTYLFHVRTADADGVLSGQVSTLRIVITPPWWLTTWAYALWVAMALSIVYGVFWFYRHNLTMKHKVQINEIEKNRVQSISEAKLRFFANISHELRTPTFLITAPLEELISSQKNPINVPRTYLLTMYRNAQRLNKLISMIIDFRKLESGELHLEKRVIDVVSLCKRSSLDYHELCKKKSIVFLYQPQKAVIELYCDPEKLEIMLSNLITNAYKYTPEAGWVTLSVTEDDNTVRLSVEDNGIGIKKEYHELIFNKFFQIDTSNSNIGDGIGLSFVKLLVEQHDGSITLESEPNKGSTFTISIPKQKPDSQDIMQLNQSVVIDFHAESDMVQEQTAILPSSPVALTTILIIDDEQQALDIVERSLNNDFRILRAADGKQGLEIAQQYLPELIICDMMMPKVDGNEFLHKIKHDKKLAHIPVIIFSANSLEQNKNLAYDMGASAYLTKPISMKYLRTRIDKLLDSRHCVQTVTVQTTEPIQRHHTKEEQKFLLRCREIIDNNIRDTSFNVITLAQQLGMSHSSLYKKIKTITGLSVIEFINDYKIFRAVQYFNQGELNINAVALQCGFNDMKNFRETFKQKMKVTPKKYVTEL